MSVGPDATVTVLDSKIAPVAIWSVEWGTWESGLNVSLSGSATFVFDAGLIGANLTGNLLWFIDPSFGGGIDGFAAAELI